METLCDVQHVTLISVVPPPSRPRHCAEIQGIDSNAESGVHMIYPDPNSVTPARVWCDMDTDGGAWTMVYSYKGKNSNT